MNQARETEIERRREYVFAMQDGTAVCCPGNATARIMS